MSQSVRMTQIEFDALATLGSMQQGPAKEASRLVLVEGLSTTAAAKQAGFIGKAGYRAAYQAVKRACEKLELAHIATGTKPRIPTGNDQSPTCSGKTTNRLDSETHDGATKPETAQ